MTTEADLVWGTTPEAALWVAEVGLRGRYVATSEGWLHWDGHEWKPCPAEAVAAAVRLALETVYERRMADDPPPTEAAALARLLNLPWRLGPLMKAVRRATAEMHHDLVGGMR